MSLSICVGHHSSFFIVMKNLFIRILSIALISGTVNNATAQDSSHMRISLLTCTPGDELYSIFGHSAIRVTDSNSVTDLVYNYGTFNFDDEGFYLKFIRGQLLYYISVVRFDEFKYTYQATNRGMHEQELNLSAKEKIDIRHALNENLREVNKYYKYDFFLDNCTTRLRDLIVKSKSPSPVLPAVMPANTRFREAIYVYLDNGKQYWSKLGIDVLLGAPTDAIMTTAHQQFLPDNLMKALDSTRNIEIVVSNNDLYPIDTSANKGGWFTPILFFTSLLTFFVILGISKNTRMQTILYGLDGLLFFLTGALGLLLIFMMTATDHSMTKNNYNILWAWPTHTIISFFINSNKKWVKTYFIITAASLVVLLMCWFALPQKMNNALVPFVLLLIFRSALKVFKPV
ncbi:MAG: DUF4105 domain-containing protein [Ferruginibacter sp.]